MSRATLRGDRIVWKFSDMEIAMLESLTSQLLGLIEERHPVDAPDDPFARWEREFAHRTDLDTSDPVIQRLFPRAYEEDDAAEADFRRFAQTGQRQAKAADAQLVLGWLATAERGKVAVPLAQVNAWLRTVTALRLSLAVRLDVEEHGSQFFVDLDDTDPRSFLYDVYEWLGYLLEAVIDLLITRTVE